MANVPLTLLVKDYDFLSAIASGDVKIEGIDLNLVRDTAGALDRTLSDPSIDAGELSFSRHLLRLANDDHSFIGIPFFITRAFRHRCFFIRQGSDMSSLTDLVGKRIGTNEWPATGNTWTRAALREQGVDIGSIQWTVGSLDGSPGKRSQGDLPSNVTPAAAGRGLTAMLLDGELDALMVPVPPAGFSQEDGPIVRLIPDFRKAEQDYYRRTGINPAHHIVGIRQEVYEQNPWIAERLYNALSEARRVWAERRRRLTETTPWLLAEIEDSAALFGADYSPDGVEPNLKMTQALIDEQTAQGLTSDSMDARTVFARYEAAVGAGAA